MKKPLANIFVALFLLPLFSSIATAQASADSVLQPGEKQTTLVSDEALDEEDNEYIMAMLDSLVAIHFFANTSFIDDTNQLNVFGFAENEVPDYPDSVVIERLEQLNQEMIIELTFNRYVKNYINAYAKKRREVASRVLGLAEVYFPLFEEYLDKYNMPLELKYLAVVESALNPTANSRAGAKGLWQFMYGTGKMYGLKVN